MLSVVIVALVVAAGVQAAPLLRVERPMRELDRWWAARHLTTGWSHGPARPGGDEG